MKTQKNNQYRLLQETIRLMILEDDIKVGDIRAALAAAKKTQNIKKGIEMAKSVGKIGVGMALKALPIAGNIVAALESGMEVADLYKSWKDLEPKVKKANGLWDKLTIDPETSAIVDDGVENEFINALSDRVARLADDDELPDADTQLAGYLKGKYSGTHIKND